MLQVKVEILGKKLAENESFNRLDRYNWRNNLEIFESHNIPFEKCDIEDCHRLGKSNTKTQLLNLSIQKLAMLVWVKNWTCSILRKLDFPEASSFFSKILKNSENFLTFYNQNLVWKWTETSRENT